jgi:hypothetical protein
VDEAGLPALSANPKLLLITGTPPGAGNVGELILRDLVLHYGAEDVECLAVVPSGYRWTAEPRLQQVPVRLLHSSRLYVRRWGKGKWSAVGSLAGYALGFRRDVRRVVAQIVAATAARRPDRILAVLNNPLMMAVAHRVAAATALPMVTLVWDPPEYLLQRARFDRVSRHLLLGDFARSLARSEQVAVVSETMQGDYARLTAAPIRILRHGVARDPAPPPVAPSEGDEWLIGFAGSLYAECAWRALLRALDRVGWRIAGRAVRLRALTERVTVHSRGAAAIEYLGYRPADATQELLAQCDLTYLPQPFVAHLRTLCRYAFPTKLTSYLALARPVFVHCPADSALARFFDAHPFGVHSDSLEPEPIVAALETLLGSRERYAAACRVAVATAREHFDASVFQRAVDRVLRPERLDVPEAATQAAPAMAPSIESR